MHGAAATLRSGSSTDGLESCREHREYLSESPDGGRLKLKYFTFCHRGPRESHLRSRFG